jgi:hypothetical protein
MMTQLVLESANLTGSGDLVILSTSIALKWEII